MSPSRIRAGGSLLPLKVIQGPRLEVLWPPLGCGHHLQTESWVGAGVGPSQREWHEVAGASLPCGLGIGGHISSLAAHCRELNLAAQPAHEEGRTGSAKQPTFSTRSVISSWLREVKIKNIIYYNTCTLLFGNFLP